MPAHLQQHGYKPFPKKVLETFWLSTHCVPFLQASIPQPCGIADNVWAQGKVREALPCMLVFRKAVLAVILIRFLIHIPNGYYQAQTVFLKFSDLWMHGFLVASAPDLD